MSGWGLGRYELTAKRLEPAAEAAVAALAVEPGDRVLDAGCGTGNAALVAARAGAKVVGIDIAERLVEVARERTAAEGSDATYEVADVTAIPAADDSFDAVVSVFGVIFGEPEPTAAELLRVVRPGGRIVMTTWIDEGPTPEAMQVVREVLDAPPSPPRWSDEEYVRRLFAPREASFATESVAFTAPSVEDYVAEFVAYHPVWLAVAPALEAKGRHGEVVERMTAIFADANEDPAAFRTTSRYRVVTVPV